MARETSSGPASRDRNSSSAATARRRLGLLIRIAASAGDFSTHLADAVDGASDFEVQIMSDLVERGLSIPALVNVLQGAHVIVGDDDLYDAWIFPASRRRMSSHHRNVDKSRTPDYGLAGPLVRESLHGKATVGTWVQLERSMATFRWGRIPTWSDVEHLRDYLIYRVTGKNVGPWGLSAHVDTRPLVLRPPNTTRNRIAARAMSEFARRRATLDRADGGHAAWSAVLTPQVPPVGPAGHLFSPPVAAHPVELLPDSPYQAGLGLGLFASLPLVRAAAALPRSVEATLEAGAGGFLADDGQGAPEPVAVPMRDGDLDVGGRVRSAPSVRPPFIGIQEER